MHFGNEEGSYLRLIDSYTTQVQAQGPSRTCEESKKEEEEGTCTRLGTLARAYLTSSVFKFVLHKSTPAQIRKLIIYYYEYKE